MRRPASSVPLRAVTLGAAVFCADHNHGDLCNPHDILSAWVTALRPVVFGVTSTVAAVLMIICTMSVPANAVQFSIRCEREFIYFLTFDTERKIVIDEVIPGAIYKGLIDRTSSDTINFSLIAVGHGSRELIWSEKTKKVTWLPGQPGDQTRLLLADDCEYAALRQVLQRYETIAPYQ